MRSSRRSCTRATKATSMPNYECAQATRSNSHARRLQLHCLAEFFVMLVAPAFECKRRYIVLSVFVNILWSFFSITALHLIFTMSLHNFISCKIALVKVGITKALNSCTYLYRYTSTDVCICTYELICVNLPRSQVVVIKCKFSYF